MTALLICATSVKRMSGNTNKKGTNKMETRKIEIVESGEYLGFKYLVVKYGDNEQKEKKLKLGLKRRDYFHYCCYIENKLNKNQNDEDLQEIVVHGGITFEGERDFLTQDNMRFIGWDYQHGKFDFDEQQKDGLLTHRSDYKRNKKGLLVEYEMEDFVKDCKDAIEQYIRNVGN